MRFITTLCASFRDYLRGWLDSCKEMTPEVTARMRAECDAADRQWRAAGPRLTNDVPTLPLNPSTEPFPLEGAE